MAEAPVLNIELLLDELFSLEALVVLFLIWINQVVDAASTNLYQNQLYRSTKSNLG